METHDLIQFYIKFNFFLLRYTAKPTNTAVTDSNISKKHSLLPHELDIWISAMEIQ